MRRRIRIEPEAEEEITAAYHWYEAKEPGLGQALINAAREGLERIERFPASGGPVPGVPDRLHVRRVPVRRFPYGIVYVELTDEITVFAFAHAKRRPGYWRRRLRGGRR